MAIQRSVKQLINRVLLWNLRFFFRLWKNNNRYCNPRYWANDELNKFAGLFPGDIINISAGQDKDKEKGAYQNYFTQAKSYTISNYKKMSHLSNVAHEIELDLSIPLPSDSELISKFQVVFSHTVLEHIYDLKTAVGNLCKISNDIVITIVPYIQPFHHEESIYHDYWRISPYALIHLFNEHASKTLYINWNNDPIGNIYIFHIASKYPERWPQIKNMNDPFGPGYYRQLLLSGLNDCPNGKITILQ